MLTPIVSAAAATGHQRRSTNASTTRPAARARSDERENVNSNPAALTTHATAIHRARRNTAASNNATVSMYAVARGERNDETSRRRKGLSEPTL